jgi:hypothetical protein
MSAIEYKIPSQKGDYQKEIENISKKFMKNLYIQNTINFKRSRHGMFTQAPPLCIGDKFDD